MQGTTTRPHFNKRIFWDVDFDALDYDKKSTFVIERVFDRGDVEDIRACRRYYGDDLIKKVLLKTKFISEQRLHLVSAIFDQPLNAFRCYTLKRLNPTRYPY